MVFLLFRMHEVLILTNVDLLPGLSRVKKMKTGRLVLQVTLNFCCLFKANLCIYWTVHLKLFFTRYNVIVNKISGGDFGYFVI